MRAGITERERQDSTGEAKDDRSGPIAALSLAALGLSRLSKKNTQRDRVPVTSTDLLLQNCSVERRSSRRGAVVGWSRLPKRVRVIAFSLVMAIHAKANTAELVPTSTNADLDGAHTFTPRTVKSAPEGRTSMRRASKCSRCGPEPISNQRCL